jgi:hypothetical protein
LTVLEGGGVKAAGGMLLAGQLLAQTRLQGTIIT